MKKILVTGGCGFIGSNFIHHVFQKKTEIEIVNLDKITYAANIQNLGDIPLQLIEVQVGSYLGEDDIVRFKDNYGRITE